MRSVTETVYLGRDNTIDLLLKADGVITDLTPITKVDIVDIGCSWSINSDDSTDAFDWSSGADGVLRLSLGAETVPAGSYRARVIIYDASNTEGIVWGEIKLTFEAACSA